MKAMIMEGENGSSCTMYWPELPRTLIKQYVIWDDGAQNCLLQNSTNLTFEV
jgi:hypothetical protein